MNTTHTPGPWMLMKQDAFGDWPIQSGPNAAYAIIATTCPQAENPEANARLIAAAPELLAACEDLFGMFRGYYSTSCEVTDALNAAKQAIKKAKGTE